MRCDSCNRELQIGDWPYCPHGSTRAHRPFIGGDVEVNGKTYHIDSLQAAERVERESMAAFKEGRGKPVVFRAFHFDHDGKHYDENAFGPGPAKHPRDFLYNQRPGKITTGGGYIKD